MSEESPQVAAPKKKRSSPSLHLIDPRFLCSTREDAVVSSYQYPSYARETIKRPSATNNLGPRTPHGAIINRSSLMS